MFAKLLRYEIVRFEKIRKDIAYMKAEEPA
jgi:hypothetical protein